MEDRKPIPNLSFSKNSLIALEWAIKTALPKAKERQYKLSKEVRGDGELLFYSSIIR